MASCGGDQMHCLAHWSFSFLRARQGRKTIGTAVVPRGAKAALSVLRAWSVFLISNLFVQPVDFSLPWSFLLLRSANSFLILSIITGYAKTVLSVEYFWLFLSLASTISLQCLFFKGAIVMCKHSGLNPVVLRHIAKKVGAGVVVRTFLYIFVNTSLRKAAHLVAALSSLPCHNSAHYLASRFVFTGNKGSKRGAKFTKSTVTSVCVSIPLFSCLYFLLFSCLS